MAEEPTDVPVVPVVETPPAETPVADPILDILTEGTQDPTKAEPSPVKEATPEVVAGTEEPKAIEAPTPPDVPTKEATPEAKAEEVVPEVQPQGKAEDRKLQLNTEIRDLVSQRNALRTDIEKINAEYYQPATEQQLVDTGLSPTDARIEALNQRLEVKDYNDRVAEAQLTIESESQAVLRLSLIHI